MSVMISPKRDYKPELKFRSPSSELLAQLMVILRHFSGNALYDQVRHNAERQRHRQLDWFV